MADTTFVNQVTRIATDWLQEVNNTVYKDQLNVKRTPYSAAGDGITNDTAALQAAVDAAYTAGNNQEIFLPAGRYLITDTINLHPGTKICGSNSDYGGVAGATSYPGQLSDSRGTVIIFAPSTEKSLFVPTLPKGGSNAWSAISIKNMNIWGNTTPDAYHRTVLGIPDDITTSKYAIDFNEVHYSTVENVAINGFQTGIREGARCQENTFTKLNIQRCRVCVEYTALTTNVEPTSSVWRECIMRTCEHVVKCTDDSSQTWCGDSLHIRFHGCYFEDCASHGFRLTRSAKDWTFFDCYGEDIGLDTGVATRSCFYVGYTAGIGTGNKLATVSIIGGQYAGDDSAVSIFCNADYTDGVNLIGCTAKRFGIGVQATANTRNKSIYFSNPLFNSVTTLLSGTTGKIHGIYRSVDMSGGSDVVQLNMDYLVSETDLQLSAPTIRLGSGSSTSVRPGANNTMTMGINGTEWSNMFSYGYTLFDGVAAPSTIAGHAIMYVDVADGDLKIKFGDGTVKTIVIDT